MPYQHIVQRDKMLKGGKPIPRSVGDRCPRCGGKLRRAYKDEPLACLCGYEDYSEWKETR